jgi:PAS domain-containing protein
LVAWLGARATVIIVADALLVQAQARLFGTLPEGGETWQAWTNAIWDALLSGAEAGIVWWLYYRVAGGARRPIDPRSASLFLFLVPGISVGLFTFGRAFIQQQMDPAGIWLWVGACWLSRSLAILALVPPVLVTVTPWLVRQGWAEGELPAAEHGRGELPLLNFGDGLEVVGLSAGTSLLGLLLAAAQREQATIGWQLWVLPLLLIVWASLRQGVRGGTIVAAAAVVCSSTFVSENRELVFLPLQGYLLAQCSTALLVGASFSWIYASESRYRQVVGHIPVFLYSARLLEPGSSTIRPRAVEVTFASPASEVLFGCPPEDLFGEYGHWLQRVHPDDRELVLAALAQLSRYKRPVTFEYRATPAIGDSEEALERALTDGKEAFIHAHAGTLRNYALDVSRCRASRWVRDTLVPIFGSDGQLLGWEGVIADITEQRFAADDLRRTTNMFHALVANLPAGVFFVQAPHGRPILVNARARQLLGKRESAAADLSEWPELYRLHKPDGSLYPTEELPVFVALRRGVTNMREDIVVHRPDGRHVPLITWAAPIDLGGKGSTDAAVWVFEDLTELRQTEVIRGSSDLPVRRTTKQITDELTPYDPPRP